MVHTPARLAVTAAVAALALAILSPASAALADTTIDGPIDMGTATPFSVLGASTVTSTGLTDLTGDLGLSPGTSITGFPPGIVNGVVHATDAVATQARADLTTAYGVAGSLTPTTSGLGDLTGLSLTPGVYAGGEVSLSGALTLAGTAQSVWVFQVASTLTIASGSIITVTGGASACNVFWRVGTSATIEPAAQFVGTVMANESVTAQTGATIVGRLMARTAAVTLDTNTITAPTDCVPPGDVSSSPEITSTAPGSGVSGESYSHTITASGTPTPSFTVSGGSLPPGLTLDSATGSISGTPTTPGTYTFDVTVANGTAPDVVVSYSLVIAAAAVGRAAAPGLAESGADGPTVLFAGILLASGFAFFFAGRYRSARART